MKPFLKSGATILLTPDPGWHWVGWDGRLTVYSLKKPLHLSGDNIIIDLDVPEFTLIAPRAYIADGFSDIPGSIFPAEFEVDRPTLSDKIKVNRVAPLLISTTGTFSCSYAMPSFKVTHAGPIPDPFALKHGTWKVVVPNQQVFFRNVDDDAGLPCKDADVAAMSHVDKMIAAIGQSGIGEAVLSELGGAKGIAMNLGIGVGVSAIIAGIALLPFEAAAVAAAAATTAVVIAGAAMAGYQVGEGINKIADFYDKTKAASTCNQIGEASQDFEEGVAKIGIGGLGVVLSFVGIRSKASGKEFIRLKAKEGEKLYVKSIAESRNFRAGTSAHKAQRWADYQAREGKWSYERWSKQYDTNIRNSSYGLERERAYQNIMDAKSKTVKTPFTYRQVDMFKSGDMYAGQLKTGKMSLTSQAKLDIKKDGYLVREGYKVEYILEKDASMPFKEALTKNGIMYKVGSQI